MLTFVLKYETAVASTREIQCNHQVKQNGRSRMTHNNKKHGIEGVTKSKMTRVGIRKQANDCGTMNSQTSILCKQCRETEENCEFIPVTTQLQVRVERIELSVGVSEPSLTSLHIKLLKRNM